MEDSEYFVQIFLFVATILCYILLSIFVFYGIYHCCMKACILRITRKEEYDGDNEKVPNSENNGYCRHVRLLYPFQKDEKKGMYKIWDMHASAHYYGESMYFSNLQRRTRIKQS